MAVGSYRRKLWGSLLHSPTGAPTGGGGGGRPWIRVERRLSRARCIRHEQGLRWGWQGGGAGLSQIRRSHPGAQVGQYRRKLWENYIRLCYE